MVLIPSSEMLHRDNGKERLQNHAQTSYILISALFRSEVACYLDL